MCCPVAYKNAVDSRRAAWRVITSVEQKEKSKSEKQLASYAREYVAKVEDELQKIREGVLALMDKKLIRSPGADESKAFYYKMKSDHYRYLAECATDDAKGKATEGTCAAYAEATEIAEKDLVVTNPVRLAMALSSVVAQRQIPNDETVQKTVETPQLQCVDKVVDDPVVQVPRVQVLEKTAEIPQLQTIEKIAETPPTKTIQGTQVPESSGITPVRQVTQTGHVEELVEVSNVFSQDTVQQRFGKQTIEIPTESESPIFVTAPMLENSPTEHMKPALAVTCAHAAPVVEKATVQLPQEIVYEHLAPLTGAAPGVTNRQVGEKDLKSDLVHIRELLGVLVRKERCAETKAEIAARRLDRMQREQHEADDAEHEANFQEALQNQSKAVKVLVDEWFVDKGFGFGRAPTGEIEFIHASAVQGAEVLADAWVQVVNDDARAQEGYRARRAWGRDTWKAERDKEKAKQSGPTSKASSGVESSLGTSRRLTWGQVAHNPRPR